MGKKHKIKVPVKKKDASYYIKVYFLSIAAGLVVFVLGTIFAKPQIPCANTKTCQTDLTQNVNNSIQGYFEGHLITPPKIDIAHDNILPSVLGDNTPGGEKHIYVDLTAQKLYAFQGNNKVMETYISSGKWQATPVGNFHIWEKLRATRMAGGEGADAYDLPNVPYVMYFYNDFGIHGAYWHNNFGHKMSHGCVNMRLVDVRDLYEWAEVGTPVSTCNSFTAPNTCIQN